MKSWITAPAIALAAAAVAFFIAGKETRYNATYTVRLHPRGGENPASTPAIEIIREKLIASGYKWDITAVEPSLLTVKVEKMKDSTWFVNDVINTGTFEICEMEINAALLLYSSWNIIDSATCELFPQTCGVPSIQSSEGQYSDSVLATMGMMRARFIPVFSKPAKYGPHFLDVNVKDTAAVGKIFRHDKVRSLLPGNVTYCFGKADKEAEGTFQLFLIKRRPAYLITSKHIKSGEVKKSRGNNVVRIRFTPEGTQLFTRLTQDNVGKPLPILYNGLLLTSPTVASAITSSEMDIHSPVATKAELEKIVHAFQAPDWPATPRLESAELKPVMERNIGSSLLVSLAVFAGVFAVAYLLFKFLKSTRPVPVSAEK